MARSALFDAYQFVRKQIAENERLRKTHSPEDQRAQAYFDERHTLLSRELEDLRKKMIERGIRFHMQ